jgi:hypothetical protein
MGLDFELTRIDTVRSHRARTVVVDSEIAVRKIPGKKPVFSWMERAGIEPATSGLQSRRSPS